MVDVYWHMLDDMTIVHTDPGVWLNIHTYSQHEMQVCIFCNLCIKIRVNSKMFTCEEVDRFVNK